MAETTAIADTEAGTIFAVAAWRGIVVDNCGGGGNGQRLSWGRVW